MLETGRGAIDPRAEVGDRPEVGMRLQPALRRVTELNAPRSPPPWGGPGTRRAPRPNRKIVAAIRPIEMPHSKIDGA